MRSWPGVHPVLGDGYILLRPFATEDAGWVYEACQDADIQRWTRLPVPYTRQHAEDFVGDLAPSEWQAGTGYHCAIQQIDDGLPVGAAALLVLDAGSGVAVAGYWVSPEHRGRGVASAALRLLSEWGFAQLGVVRIELHVDSGNEASLAVGKRIGFEQEGVLRQKVLRLGQRRDLVMLAQVRPSPPARS